MTAEMPPTSAGWIQTFSGGRFYPLSPNPDDIRIADVAHALSLNNRFTGHADRGYSVGEHSLLVVRILHLWGQSPETLLWGLLHDASEAYIADIARPLKVMPEFQFYRDMEKKVMDAVSTRFNLELTEPAIVKAADTVALAIEAKALLPRRELSEWAWLPDIPEDLVDAHLGHPSEVVEKLFLKTYYALEAARGKI